MMLPTMRLGRTLIMSSLLRKYIRNKLIEQASNKGSLIVVDIQPEYESGATFDIGDMLRAAAEYNEVLFLYNGADTLGMIDEQSLRNYYFEKLDYDEETYEELMSVSEFFDKGYGFFRDVMDSDICFDRNSVIKIVKYMIDNNVQDIRDLDEEDVQSIGVSELLFDDLEDYGFWVPELQDVLPQWNGSDIAGGARNECLAEVEILAAAQGLSFRQVNEFIYEGDNRYTEGMLSESFKVKGSSDYFRVDLPGIGYAQGGENLRFKECQDDVDAIMQMPEYLDAKARFESNNTSKDITKDENGKWVEIEKPAKFRPRFYDVENAWITNPENRGKGHGKEIYKAFINKAIEYSKSYGGVFIGAHRCTIGSGTSEDAQRVWKSLGRDYTSSGMVIFVGL